MRRKMQIFILVLLQCFITSHVFAMPSYKYRIRTRICEMTGDCEQDASTPETPTPPSEGLSIVVTSPYSVVEGGVGYIDVGLVGDSLEEVSLSFESSNESLVQASNIALVGGTPSLRNLEIPLEAGVSGSAVITIHAVHTDGRNAVASVEISTFLDTVATFNYTGGEQEYIVPEGVDRILVELWGGAGGGYRACGMYGCSYGYGGGAGYSVGELNVVSGETITVVVGGGGQLGESSAGWPNGTSGAVWSTSTTYTTTYYSGGGGGMSAVKRGGTLLMAAGGGGGSRGGQAGGGGGFMGDGSNGASQVADGANFGTNGGGGYFIGGLSGGGSAYLGGVTQANTVGATSNVVADDTSANYPGSPIGTGFSGAVGGDGFAAITPIPSPTSNTSPVISVVDGINFAAEDHSKDVFFAITDDYTSYDELVVTVESLDEDVVPSSEMAIVRRGSMTTDNFIVRFTTNSCANFVPVRVTATDEKGLSSSKTFDVAFFHDAGSDVACSIGSTTARLRVDMWGAAGGGFSACNMYGCWYGAGGGGGYTGGILSVTGGESLQLQVGTGGLMGLTSAGWPNATTGNNWSTSTTYTTTYYSGGGGGMSAVKRSGTLLAAAGGGGGSPSGGTAGGGGGLSGGGTNGATQTADGSNYGLSGGGGYFIGGAGGGGSAYIGGISSAETIAATSTEPSESDRATFPGDLATGVSNAAGSNGFMLLKKVAVPTSNSMPVITVESGTNFAAESHPEDIYFTITDDNTSPYDMNVSVVSNDPDLVASSAFSIVRRGGSSNNFALRVNTDSCINKVSVTVSATDEGGLTNNETFDVAWFFPAGTTHSCTVPASVTSLRASLWGAAGGGYSSCSIYGCSYGSGGGGGYSIGDVPVTGGETLQVMVGSGGGVGLDSAGWPNGTSGNNWSTSTTYTTTYYSGGGGGMTTIQRTGTNLIVAGGGGGFSSGGTAGGGGGLTGGGSNGATQTDDGSNPGYGGGGGYFVGGSSGGGSGFIGTLANANTIQASGTASAGQSATGYPTDENIGVGSVSAAGGNGFILIVAD